MTAIDPSSDCPITATASMEPATPSIKTQKQPPIVERQRRRGHGRAHTYTARCTGILYATNDEWNYIVSAQGRLTVFVAPESSQTYDFRAGDVGHIPSTSAHRLENTRDEDLVCVGGFGLDGGWLLGVPHVVVRLLTRVFLLLQRSSKPRSTMTSRSLSGSA